MININPTLFSPPPPVARIPRDYQEDAINAFFSYFDRKAGNPLVVIPTGGGKSLVIAEIVRRAIQGWKGTRVSIVSHVSELITQNAEALLTQFPDVHISFCSDKLDSKDLSGEVVMGTIQSMYRRALSYPEPPDFVLIDECHLLKHDDNTMYRKFLDDLKLVNPYLKVIGFTATPFRTDRGRLHKGKNALFTDIAYEIGILDLINRGFLTPVFTPPVQTRMDVHNVKISKGDYAQGELERAVDVEMITRGCVREIIEMGGDRRKWLVFTAGVNHCEHVRDEIRKYDIPCEMLTGTTPTSERNQIVARYKSGDLRCLVNVAVFTTGFDNPAIDLIAFMRPTRSPVLYIQTVGRGMRLAPQKLDCMLLDFGQVVETLGPIDQVYVKDKRKESGEAPKKYCPECGEECHAAILICPTCGYEFPPHELDINKEASAAAVLSTQLQTEEHNVTHVFYYRHKKEGKPDSMRVEYMTGPTKSFRRWQSFEHSGPPRTSACAWWRERAKTTPPNTITEALERTGELRKPSRVFVRKAGKYYEIVGEE